MARDARFLTRAQRVVSRRFDHPVSLSATGRLAAPVFLGALPLAVLVLVVYRQYATGFVAVDFHNVYYPAAHNIIDGLSPYAEAPNRWVAYVPYTPVVAILVVPLTVLPVGVAQVIASLALLACFVATPYVLGVSDWRVVGVMLLWASFVSGLQTANVTFLLGLLCAFAWRWRHRRMAPGIVVGLAIGLKLFLWPMALWLLATRRLAASLTASFIAGVSVMLIPLFVDPDAYLRLLREHTAFFADESYTLFALLVGIGAPDWLATTVWLGVGLFILVWGRKSFILCLAAALALSPIVWLHYFALLAVPLAIAGAPLLLWAVPILLWLAPGFENGGTIDQLLVLTVVVLTFAVCYRRTAGLASGHERHRWLHGVRPATDTEL